MNGGVDVLTAEPTGIPIDIEVLFSNLGSVYDDVLRDAVDRVWKFYSVKVKSMELVLSCEPRSSKVYPVIMGSLNDGQMAICGL